MRVYNSTYFIILFTLSFVFRVAVKEKLGLATPRQAEAGGYSIFQMFDSQVKLAMLYCESHVVGVVTCSNCHLVKVMC